MFDYGKVETVIGRIVENVDPDMIVVFGSVARREARDDSDLDILVVFDRPYNHK
ncbi:MAG: nucleotidyltransferase domain-containing protein, partial [Candidatus Methanomethylophilaceae archaeon]|nr:nucleotidyltransferase domain-containing protein [Candidatus Methanomethylophilaceae archaeon]